MKLVPYTGEKIHEIVPEIAALRMKVFREYPYLYIGNEESERRYLSMYVSAKDALIIVAYDGSKIVGVVTGIPLTHALDAIKAPFSDGKHRLEEIYYLGEIILEKNYRGQGIGHQFFDLFEENVHQFSRYKSICLCTVKRNPNDPRRPKDYYQLDQFWEKRGYSMQPQLCCFLSWQEIGEAKESPKEMVFWIKKL